MKKLLFLTYFIFAPMIVNAETIYSPSDLSYEVDTFIDKKTNKPATGVIKKDTTSIPIKNGKEHGKAVGSYYGDKVTVVFNNGNVISSELISKRDKSRRKTTFYEGTSIPTVHEVYDEKGNIKENYHFTKDGFLSDFIVYESPQKVFEKGYITDKDGKVELPARHDIIYFGKSIVLDSRDMELDKNLPRFKESDLNIKENGKFYKYLDKKGNVITGIVESEGRFHTVTAGHMNGPYKLYQNGRLLEEGMYKNGQRIAMTTYDEQGNKTSDYVFGYSENAQFKEPSYIYIKYYNGHPVKALYAFFGFSIGTRFDYYENGLLAGKTVYSTPDKERDYIYQEGYSEKGRLLGREMRYIDVGNYTVMYNQNGQPTEWHKDILGIRFDGMKGRTP